MTTTTPTFGRAGEPVRQSAVQRTRAEPRDTVRDGAGEPIEFTGRAGEFFGIWIVNILLSVLTLGIYSAWAKVRTRRYFAGNTRLLGHAFDYHARPTTILKGRVVALAVIIALNVVAELEPRAAILVLAVYAVAVPWAIVRGVSFNANMTSYRNVRFGFEGSKWHAFRAFLMWPFLSAASLGALVPFGSRSRARFLGGHRYGRSEFFVDPSVGGYYRALGHTLLPVIGLVVLVFGALFALSLAPSSGSLTMMASGVVAPLGVALYASFLVVPVFYRTLSRNHTFDSLSLAGRRLFASTMNPWRMSWIALSNIVVVVLTLGLMTPWAMVRTARYKAAHTLVQDRAAWDEFVAAEVDRSGVASGEFLDLDGGFDVGV